MAIVPRTILWFFLAATTIVMIAAYVVSSLLNEGDGVLLDNITNPPSALAAAVLALTLYLFTRGSPLVSRVWFTSVKPAGETEFQKEVTRELPSRNTYVIWSTDSRKGYELMVSGLSKGLEGLIITRKPPAAIRSTYGIKKTVIFWLSTSPGNEVIHPGNTGILTDTVTRFLAKGKHTIILLDGFESIVTYTDFKKALMTLDHLKDLVVAHNSRMIVPIDKRTLTDKEAALTEKKAVIIQG